MKGESGLLDVVGLIIDPGDEIINGALAQDARKASVALDGGVVDLDYHLSSQLNHWAGSPSGLDQFHWRRTYLFRFVFLCQRLMVNLLSVACPGLSLARGSVRMGASVGEEGPCNLLWIVARSLI